MWKLEMGFFVLSTLRNYRSPPQKKRKRNILVSLDPQISFFLVRGAFVGTLFKQAHLLNESLVIQPSLFWLSSVSKLHSETAFSCGGTFGGSFDEADRQHIRGSWPGNRGSSFGRILPAAGVGRQEEGSVHVPPSTPRIDHLAKKYWREKHFFQEEGSAHISP